MRRRTDIPSRAVRRGPARSGFTLFEVALSLGLLLVLAAIAVVSVTALGGSRLSEDAQRLESVIAMARAESARKGQRHRLLADEQGLLMMQVESDPLGRPGQFDRCAENWALQLPGETLRLRRLLWTGPDAWRNPTDDQQALEPPSLTFYPDGSNDWVEMELTAEDESVSAMLLSVEGLSGRTHRQVVESQE